MNPLVKLEPDTVILPLPTPEIASNAVSIAVVVALKARALVVPSKVSLAS